MIYLLTLLTLLSFGILIVLFLRNMELKEQINKGLEENADNLSDQISFQLESFAKTNQLETTKQLNQLQMELYQQKFYIKICLIIETVLTNVLSK